MKKNYRAIQLIKHKDGNILPGTFVDKLLSKEEIEKYLDSGYVAEKIYPKPKKVKDGNRKNTQKVE